MHPNRQTVRQTNIEHYTHKCIHAGQHVLADSQGGRKTYGRADRQTEKTESKTDRQAGRQAGRHRHQMADR